MIRHHFPRIRAIASARLGVLAFTLLLTAFAGCTKQPVGTGQKQAGSADAAPGASNRVDIPAPVRANLGITFAKVERRNVTQTLRVPGRFELLPTARREYRAPLSGRIELLVKHLQAVEAGTPLFSLDSAAWQILHDQVQAAEAKVASLTPLRQAHRIHEESLVKKVQLWKDRLRQLEELRTAGGGSGAQFTEARAMLNGTEAELADVTEKDAELEFQQAASEAELRSLVSRREALWRVSGSPRPTGDGTAASRDARFVVHATAPGIVEVLSVVSGGLAEDSGLVITTIAPADVRFRARGSQSDISKLRDGLPARIVPQRLDAAPTGPTMEGPLALGLTADADERTLDLFVEPRVLAPWARAGVSAQLEIALAGSSATNGTNDQLAIPTSAVVRDGATPIIFRRDPKDPDKVIRMEADIAMSDGRWTVINSGVREGDEIVLDGNYQLMLATTGSASKAGHFHSDGTFHEGKD